MKYLTLHETTAAYEAAESGLIMPHVALTLDNNEVHYKPLSPTPPTPSHDYVEIGGIKWATMNVGASSITDTGLYFQWGDTQGYTAAQVGTDKIFTWNGYKHTNDGGSTMSKYNSTDGKTVLDASDDAVTAAWGGNWRMPTVSEFIALGEAVITAWTADYQGSGVAGLVCTDNNDDSKVLFFPGGGSASNTVITSVGELGTFWSSSLLNSNITHAIYLLGDSMFPSEFNYHGFRYYGRNIRGVLDE